MAEGERFEKPQVETVQLLPLAEAIPEFKSVEKEEVRVGNIKYRFPSPAALQAKLTEVYYNEKDISVQALTVDIMNRLIPELKRGKSISSLPSAMPKTIARHHVRSH